jgi:membrane protease YdiL (CAAX protease family)
MKERLLAADYRFILICLLLLAGTAWFSALNFQRAFPEASIDFKVDRDDARTLAANFLAGQGYKLGSFRQAAQFSYDDDAKTFLEREAGLERANQLMGGPVRLWRWSYRWFKPLTKEEFTADVTPAGTLVGFNHELAENDPRPAITAEAARAAAEDLLRTRMGRKLENLEFVEATDVARPHRVDRTFTWKQRDFSLRDATLRVEVTLLGDEVGGYREYLKVPEQWQRDYQLLRSKNEVTQTVDTAVMAVLMVCLIVVIAMRVRLHDIPWRRASLVGLAAIVLAFLAQLNEFPLHEFGYPTTDSYESFVSRQVLNAMLAALAAGGFLFVLTAGAEPVYREICGGQISLGNLFTVGGLRTKRFFKGAILGITLTGIFIAYQTAFYIVAYRHGAWSPADVPYTDLLNTKFPWAFVLFGGFFPAVSEEFLFRMFAIPFLKKVTRSVVAAVVLAGFIWGFGHAGYPQQPFYIRGLEVGMGGVALGIVMLRFGILPTLVWHYSVDAMYSAMLLVRSHSLYYKLSGLGAAGIMLLPVAIALVAYWRNGGFLSDAGLLNRDEPAPPEPAPEAPQEAIAPVVAYTPLSRRMRWVATTILLAGLAMLVIPVARFGTQPEFKTAPESAQRAADAFLRARGIDPASFRHVAYPASRWDNQQDATAGKYFLERLSLNVVSKLFERYRPIKVWMIRYYRPLDQEEFEIGVHPETASVTGFTHTLPEDRPGADLPAEPARQLAAQYAASRGWDTGSMDLKVSDSEKQKARRDYTFQWEARLGDSRNVGETRWRVEVELSGDQITAGRTFWKVPETYLRERERTNALAIAILVAKIAGGAGIMVWGIWLLIQVIRQGQVRWRTVITIAAAATLLIPIGPALKLGIAMKDYRTDIPIGTFQAMQYVSIALAAMRRGGRARMAWDAVAVLAAGIGLAAAANRISELLVQRFHAQAIVSIPTPELIGTSAPVVAAAAAAASGLLGSGALLAMLALFIQHATKWWLRIAAAVIGIVALIASEVRTPGEFALQAAIALLWLAAIALCWTFARKNYLAYALLLWAIALYTHASTLLGTGNAALNFQGWVLIGLIAAGVVWAVSPTFNRGN